MRQALGTAVFFGMIRVTIFGLLRDARLLYRHPGDSTSIKTRRGKAGAGLKSSAIAWRLVDTASCKGFPCADAQVCGKAPDDSSTSWPRRSTFRSRQLESKSNTWRPATCFPCGGADTASSTPQATITQALRIGCAAKAWSRRRSAANASSWPNSRTRRTGRLHPPWPSPTTTASSTPCRKLLLSATGSTSSPTVRADNLNFTRALDSKHYHSLCPWSNPSGSHEESPSSPPKSPSSVCRNIRPALVVRIRSVQLDDYEIGRTATNHLLQLGHRNIVAMTSEPQTTLASQRLSAWRDAWKSRGAPDRPLAG